MKRFLIGVALVASLVAPAAAQTSSQPADPTVRAVTADWMSLMNSAQHVTEDVNKLIQRINELTAENAKLKADAAKADKPPAAPK